MSLATKIVETTLRDLGQKEKSGNSGFYNKVFEDKMKAMGWSTGQSWCAYFAESCWKQSFGKDHPLYTALDKLFSGSAVATWSNFKTSAKFKTGATPKPGAVVIWRHGSGWQGHAGIVVEATSDGKEFVSVEGNSNSSGSREGIMVARKKRRTGQPFASKGLNLLGFVYPPES